MSYTKVSALDATGYVVLRDSDLRVPDDEYLSLEYLDWKSGGDTNFAPIASAHGDLECAGFWDHGKPDKDGIWTDNAKRCPTIVEWVNRVGVNFGRVRTIKLEPQSYERSLEQIHLDDNNRLNPDEEGWVVRAWLELSDNPGAQMVLREDGDDPATETCIDLHPGLQYVVDSERLWHVVSNPTDRPRYALIASFESGPALERWIESQLP
jgi:hypothetical protein